jgi:spore coat protein CotH
MTFRKVKALPKAVLFLATQFSIRAALAQEAPLTVEEKSLFDWAEYTYPVIFAPAGPETVRINGYLARYYAATDSYLGQRNQNVYATGNPFRYFPVAEGSIRLLGPYTDYVPRMHADGFGVVTGEKLLLSEAVSSDPNGGPDWFEVHNAGSVPVALAAYQVKDEGADRQLQSLPARTLAPGEYLVIAASDTLVPGATPVVPFNLGDSDKVQLFKQGTLVDELAWDDGEAKYGSSVGRYPGPLSRPRPITSTRGTTNKPEAGWGRNALGSVGSLRGGQVHDISLRLDPAAFNAMVEAYKATGEKEWIESTVFIDGVEYRQVGVRLKGNSSLCEVILNPNPTAAPLLVKLNHFVQKQHHEGLQEFVVRSNPNKTALNEAVALELLEQAGLAAQDAIATRFSVNDGNAVLRLVIESPDGEWMAEEFARSGALYKAEATGDYSYRGEDPALYDEVFDQEAGSANADLAPLIAFLKFINEADDAAFRSGLPARLNVDGFATYLAMQELLQNFDDIDGPGNNAYWYYDTASGQFSVVPWDYNLAFGQLQFEGPPPGGELPPPPGPGPMPGVEPGDNFVGCGGGGVDFRPAGGDFSVSSPDGERPGRIIREPGNGADSSNILVRRFLAVPEWKALYEQKQAALRTRLYTSGIAAQLLGLWAAIVDDSGLVDSATLQSEASAIRSDLN